MSASSRRYLSFGLAVALALVSGLALVLFALLFEADYAADAQATVHFEAIMAAEGQAAAAQGLALAAQSQAELAQGNSGQALALALEAIKIYPGSLEVQASLAEAAYAPGIRRRIDLPELYAGGGIAVMPDGKTLLYADSRIHALDLATGQILPLQLDPGGRVRSLVLSPDGSRLLSMADGICRIWTLADQALIATPDRDLCGYANLAVFNADGSRLFLAAGRQGFAVWDVASDRLLTHLSASVSNPRAAAFDPDGQTVLLSFFENTLVQLDVATGTIVRQYQGHVDPVGALVFAPDGRTFFTAGIDVLDPAMLVWDASSGTISRVLESPPQGVDVLALSPDARWLVGGVRNTGDVVLWDVATGRIVHTYPEMLAATLAFSADSRHVVAGPIASEAGSGRLGVYVLDVFSGAEQVRLAGRFDRGAAISPDSRTLLVQGTDGGVWLWDLASGELLRRMIPDQPTIPGGIVFPLEDSAFSIGSDCRLTRWDAGTGAMQGLWRIGDALGCRSLAASSEGLVFAIGMHNQAVVWDAATGEIRQRLAHESGVDVLSFSPDGRMLFTGTREGRVLQWDVQRGERVQAFEDEAASRYPPFVKELHPSPDGRTLLVIQGDTAFLWDVASGQIVLRLEGIPGGEFSPDGALLGLTRVDGTVVLWDRMAGRELRRWQAATLAPGERFSGGLRFSPDGRWLITPGGTLGEIVVWRIDADGAALVDWALYNRYVPPLSCADQDRFRAEAACGPDGVFPTYTPVPSLTATPTLDFTRVTPTASRTAVPSPTWDDTILPTFSPTPGPPTFTIQTLPAGPFPVSNTPAPVAPWASPTLALPLVWPTATLYGFPPQPTATAGEPQSARATPTSGPVTATPRPTRTGASSEATPTPPRVQNLPPILETGLAIQALTSTATATAAPRATRTARPTWTPVPTRIVITVAAGDTAGLIGAIETVNAAGHPAINAGVPTVTIQTGDVAGLIAALEAANAAPDPDVITLAAGVYTFTAAYAGETALPAITTEITLQGAGAVFERPAGGPDFRFFLVESSGSLTVHDLTMTGGGGFDLDGGSLFNRGTLDLDRVTIRASRARNGGALFNDHGRAIVRECILSDNEAAEAGGAIATLGSGLSLRGGDLAGNRAGSGGSLYLGS